MVVYRALYGEHGLWVRPAKMFFETIERDGKRMKRFELLEDAMMFKDKIVVVTGGAQDTDNGWRLEG